MHVALAEVIPRNVVLVVDTGHLGAQTPIAARLLIGSLRATGCEAEVGVVGDMRAGSDNEPHRRTRRLRVFEIEHARGARTGLSWRVKEAGCVAAKETKNSVRETQTE